MPVCVIQVCSSTSMYASMFVCTYCVSGGGEREGEKEGGKRVCIYMEDTTLVQIETYCTQGKHLTAEDSMATYNSCPTMVYTCCISGIYVHVFPTSPIHFHSRNLLSSSCSETFPIQSHIASLPTKLLYYTWLCEYTGPAKMDREKISNPHHPLWTSYHAHCCYGGQGMTSCTAVMVPWTGQGMTAGHQLT